MTANRRTYYVFEPSPSYPVGQLEAFTRKLEGAQKVRASSRDEAIEIVRDELNRSRMQALAEADQVARTSDSELSDAETKNLSEILTETDPDDPRYAEPMPGWTPSGDGVDHLIDEGEEYDPAECGVAPEDMEPKPAPSTPRYVGSAVLDALFPETVSTLDVSVLRD